MAAINSLRALKGVIASEALKISQDMKITIRQRFLDINGKLEDQLKNQP